MPVASPKASVSAVSPQNFATASAKLPKPKRVTFILEASARVRTAAGADVFSQILWMKLDGLSNEAIATSLGLSVDTIGDIIASWQTQVELKEPMGWQPRARNPRKTRRSVYHEHPTPKY